MTKGRSHSHAKITTIVKYKAKSRVRNYRPKSNRNKLQNVLPEMME